MIPIAVVGASGYTGGELLRILTQHPGVNVVAVTSEVSAGKPVTELFPSLEGFYDLRFEALRPEAVAERAQFVFTALPHKTAMETVARFVEVGVRVVDLSADYRLSDPEVYARWYGVPHSRESLLKEAVYGLPELNREAIRKASLVANPGCYPTGSILALAPLIAGGIVDANAICIDAKSGLSGAGRGLSLPVHFPEANEGLEAYQIGTHRHIPEIEQALSGVAGREIRLTFVPHRIPMNRGILTTVYAPLALKISRADLLSGYRSFYQRADFVKILENGFPNVRDVKGSNFCHIGATIEERTGRLVAVSAIDNLGKGAAGQAVQNMNLMLGFEEGTALKTPGIFP